MRSLLKGILKNFLVPIIVGVSAFYLTSILSEKRNQPDIRCYHWKHYIYNRAENFELVNEGNSLEEEVIFTYPRFIEGFNSPPCTTWIGGEATSMRFIYDNTRCENRIVVLNLKPKRTFSFYISYEDTLIEEIYYQLKPCSTALTLLDGIKIITNEGKRVDPKAKSN